MPSRKAAATKASRTHAASTPIQSASPPATPSAMRSSLRVGRDGGSRSGGAGVGVGSSRDMDERYDEGVTQRIRDGAPPVPDSGSGMIRISPSRPGRDHGAVQRFPRSSDDRLVVGVAGGLAARLGVPSTVVRLLVVLLALCGGVGVAAYLVAFACSTDGEVVTAEPVPPRTTALCALVAAVLVVCRAVGLWPGDGIGVPAVIATGGALIVWWRRGRELDPFAGLLSGRWSTGRVVGGAVLVVGGLVTMVAGGDWS